MVDAMRAMLDSLMGKERNAIPSERKKLSPEEQRRQRLRDPGQGGEHGGSRGRTPVPCDVRIAHCALAVRGQRFFEVL